jgi:transposase
MLTQEDLLAFEKTFTYKKTYRRFLCTQLKIVDPKKQAEIAQHTGYSLRQVQRIQAQVQQHGLHILNPKKGIRRNSLLPNKQVEMALLDQHKGKVGIYDLHQALNAQVGRNVGFQSGYRLLNRHG